MLRAGSFMPMADKIFSLPEDFCQLRYQLLPLVINKSMLFVRGEDDLAVGVEQDKRGETTYRIQVGCRSALLLRVGCFVHHGPGTCVLTERIVPGIGVPVCGDADDEQALLVILLIEFLQHGERADAGTAPRCPEVKQDILPLACIFGQAMHGAVWQLGLEVDERLAYDGQLRLWLKVEFPPFLVYLVPCKY